VLTELIRRILYNVKETSFGSARHLLDHIRLSQPHWGRAPTSTWIFRGQANASWSLVPRAWRSPGNELVQRLAARSLRELVDESARLSSLVEYILTPAQRKLAAVMDYRELGGKVLDALSQATGEMHAIDEFVQLADNVGLRIPSTESSQLDRYMSRLLHAHMTSIMEGYHEWLEPTPDDTFGLAQHHGVPTRLIDFTRNPLVAAFFAVQRVEGENIAVWAVDSELLSAYSSIRMLNCRRYDNSFLHAQDGLFLWDTIANATFIATGVWPTLDAVIEQAERASGAEIVRKLTLPASQAQRLLRLLWRERVSLAHLMPSYDNIAKSLPTYWDLVETHLDDPSGE
jgi:FRG domain-containing protein